MRGRGPAWLPVFAVVFPTVVGGGILALPVALAPLGPLLAVAVTALLGLVNILTIGLLAVSVVRRADSLPPYARLATLSRDLLGRGAAVITAWVVGVLMLGLVVVYALGLSDSLATSIGLPAPLWALAALAGSALLVGFQFRRALMTAGTAVTVTSILLLGTLMLLLLRHVDTDLLTAGPPAPLGIPSFALVFGALMGAYFGHTSVPTIAPATLRSDPSGRSLIVGSVAAMSAATVVNTGWVFVTLGSTPAAEYLAEGSTGIDLVSQVAGPVAGWLTVAFVLLALGVAGMISAFVLGDLAVEQLPLPRSLSLDLSRGAVLHGWDGDTDPVVITLASTPDHSAVLARAQRGRKFATAAVTPAGWNARYLLAAVDGRRWGRWLRVDLVGATVEVRSTMLLEVESRKPSAAVHVLDEGLPGRVTAHLLRQPRTVAGLTEALDSSEADVVSALETLSDQGVAERGTDEVWHVHLGHRRRVGTGHALNAPASAGSLDMAPRSPAWLATNIAARVVAIVPLIVALAMVLGLQASGATFAEVFSLIGISAFVLVGTTIPLLIAIASRRSADRVVPAGVLGVPQPVLWGLWAATVAVCTAYALVIYEVPGERIAAASAVVLSLLSGALARRARSFDGSSALVLSVEPDGALSCRLTDDGRARQVPGTPHVPVTGHSLDVSLDPVPHGPLRVVVRQADAPRHLVGPRVRSATGALDCAPAATAGSGVVDVVGATAPVTVSWLVD